MQEMNTKKELKRDFGIFFSLSLFLFFCDTQKKVSRKFSFWLASCLMRLQLDIVLKVLCM
jgi:hypothetical protein